MADAEIREIQRSSSGHSITVGQFDLSIATSLAIEGLLGIHPENSVKPPPVESIDELWVNVTTLIRNAYNALGDGKNSITSDELSFIVHAEMIYLSEILKDKYPFLVTRFYITNESMVKKRFLKINYRVPTTHKQKTYRSVYERTLRAVIRMSLDMGIFDINGGIQSTTKRVLLLTHHITDLLLTDVVPNLQLLESHTGVVKGKTNWSTKLNGKLTENIPFSLFTVNVFGDNGGMLNPLPLKYRQLILDMATKNRWTTVTTEAKVKMNINTISDKEMRDTLLSLF